MTREKLNRKNLKNVQGGKNWGIVNNYMDIQNAQEGDTCMVASSKTPLATTVLVTYIYTNNQ